MLKNILLQLLLALADILVTALVKAVAGSTAPKQLLSGLVETMNRTDMSGAERWTEVQALAAAAKADFKADLHRLPDSLKNLVIELSVAKAKAKIGQLQP